jgi:hypothetical protein
MRLVLACLAIFLAPSGALFLSVRQVEAIQDDFLEDAKSQIDRLERISALYPPNVRRMQTAPAILQLRELYGGANIAANVCATPDSPYQRLFERLSPRCDEWRLYRRARSFAFLSAVAALAVLALALMARISVLRYVERQQRPGNLTLLFILRGIPLLLAGQIAVALLGYGVLLQNATGKASYAAAILTVPFLILFALERHLVLGYVEPGLFGGRARGATRRRWRRRSRS